MRNDAGDGILVAKNGWRQGSVLSPSLVRTLIAEHQIPSAVVPRSHSRSGWFSGLRNAWKKVTLRRAAVKDLDARSDLWMVVSQDCDVVHTNLQTEPYVEVLRLTRTTEKLGEAHWGKNPRRYQFEAEGIDRTKSLFNAIIHEKVRIDRAYLVDSLPDSDCRFDVDIVRDLCRWVGQRYVRAAFANEFNRRAKRSFDRLRKKGDLRKYHQLLTAVLIEVEEDELPEGEDYHPIILVTMMHRDFRDPKRRESAEMLRDAIEAAVGSCDGIDIKEASLRSEQDVTMDHLRTYKRWDYDDLSLREQSRDDMSPSL